MDNPMSKYLGRELKGAIDSFKVVQGTSKEGTIYYCLEFKFANGYAQRLFPRDAERFAILNAIDYSETEKHQELDF